MSRLSKFSGVALIGFAVSTVASLAWAAEEGTYRPGAPYQSLPLQNAMMCETQCRSDSDCQGWNFVKVSPRQKSGVCEFNAQSVAPISSAISISGNGAIGQISSRLVSKGTRTVRIGAPSMQKPAHTQIQTQSFQQRRLQSKLNTQYRTVRDPIPNRESAIQSDYRSPYPTSQNTSAMSLTQQQAIQKRGYAPHIQHRPVSAPSEPQSAAPRLMHSLDGGLKAGPEIALSHQSETSYSAPPSPSATAAPRLQHSLGQSSILQPQDNSYSIERGNTAPPQYQKVQSSVAKLAPRTQKNTLQAQEAPVRRAHVQTPHPKRLPLQTQVPQTQVPQTQPPQTMRAAESSLFGSLHDDVAQPKPLTSSEIANPDAPISTSASVPAKKFTIDTLMGPPEN